MIKKDFKCLLCCEAWQSVKPTPCPQCGASEYHVSHSRYYYTVEHDIGNGVRSTYGEPYPVEFTTKDNALAAINRLKLLPSTKWFVMRNIHTITEEKLI